MDSEHRKIIRKIQRRMWLDDDRNADFQAYDDIDEMDYTLPFEAEQWVRKQVSSVGHNALKTTVNMFNTYNPKWELLPRGPDDADKAEELERWLEWQMMKANTRNGSQPFRKMLKSGVKYGVVAAQLDYLPYWTDGKDKKKYLEGGAFCVNVHEEDAANIHYEIGKYGIRWVAEVSSVTSAFIFDHWEQYENDPKVKKALEELREYVENEEEECYFIYIDYTDMDRRWVFYYESDDDVCNSESLNIFSEDGVVNDVDIVNIVDQKNDLGFINWAITEVVGEPLLKSMHKSGSWENQCLIETISHSTVMRRAWEPLMIHTSPTGEPVDIDYTGVDPVVELKQGEQATPFPQRPLDPAVRELLDRNSNNMSLDAGVRGLQNTDITGNIQFATVNAQIQLSKTVIDPAIRAFETACMILGYLAFKWIEKEGDVVTAYRSKTSKGKKRGMKINVSPKDFDAETIQISCELLANTPTDDMQRWNMFSGMKQVGLHIPDGEFIERMEMGDPETLESKWLDEQALNLAWALFQQKKQAELQMQVQQQAQAAQQAAMAAASQGGGGQVPPQQGAGTPAFDQTQGQGFDPSRGGSSPMEAAPQMTQTSTRQP